MDNKVVKFLSPVDFTKRKVFTLNVAGRTVSELIELFGIKNETAYVAINKQRVIDKNRIILPGELIHILDTPQGDGGKTIGMIGLSVLAMYASGGISGLATAAGWGTAASTMAGSMAAMATMVSGSYVLNSIASPGKEGSGAPSGSPTYEWSANQNTAQEGLAIPVIYGNVATYPQIINRWIEVDNDENESWIHTLLCVGEGETNNLPTVNDVYVDDLALTGYPYNSYEFNTNYGRGDVSRSLEHFEWLHQMRYVGAELLTSTMCQILLHYNEEPGGDYLYDDGAGVGDYGDEVWDVEHYNTWTPHGAADTSDTHPFLGACNLDLTTYGSYISCDEYLAFDIWTRDTWQFETRFRQSTIGNSAIIGQRCIDSENNLIHYWCIMHYDNALLFQQFARETTEDEYTLYFSCSADVTLTVDTWHHISVARTTERNGTEWNGSTIYFFLDGVLISDVNSTTEPVEPPEDGTWSQNIGFSYRYTGSGISAEYAECELDETRFCIHTNLYDLDGFDVPVTEVTNDEEQRFYTKGDIDYFSITVKFPNGLYKYSDGAYYDARTDFWISYRKIGSQAWYRYYAYAIACSTSKIVRQWQYAPSLGRGKYEIRIAMLSQLDPNATYQRTCVFDNVDEVLNEDLYYPYLQLIGVSIKAQEKISNNLPQIRVISNRDYINTYKFGSKAIDLYPAQNNARCAYDMLTNKVYGAGVSPLVIDYDEWVAWYRWCESYVYGTTHRCRINTVFDETMTLDEAFQIVEACGRAQLMPKGSKIGVIVDRPSDAVHQFIPENCSPGSMSMRVLPTSERSDAVEITYFDKDTDFSQQMESHVSPDYYTLTRQPRVARYTMYGINTADQAKREAILRQQLSQSILMSATCQTGLEGMPVSRGDVYLFSMRGNKYSYSGRLNRGDTRASNWWFGQYTPYDNLKAIMWVEAEQTHFIDDGDTIAVADDPVYTLVDMSGNNNHFRQATEDYRPLLKRGVINGYPAFRFDGTDDYANVTLTGGNLAQPFTIFMISAVDASHVNDDVGHNIIDSLSAGNRWTFAERDATDPDQYGIYAGSAAADTGIAVDSSWHLHTIVANGSSTTYRLDGGLVSSTLSPGSDSVDGFTIGARYDGLKNVAFDCALFVVFEGALSNDDIGYIEALVINKYLVEPTILDLYSGYYAYLDREITLESALYYDNCMITVRDIDDEIYEYDVIGPWDVATRYVMIGVPATFSWLSPYIVSRKTGDVFTFRADQVTRSGDIDIKIVGKQYDNDAYYHEDYGSRAI